MFVIEYCKNNLLLYMYHIVHMITAQNEIIGEIITGVKKIPAGSASVLLLDCKMNFEKIKHRMSATQFVDKCGMYLYRKGDFHMAIKT